MGGCAPGDAKITGAGKLPCTYVIHAVGPVWRGGGHGEAEKLRSCYEKALLLAREKQCSSIAFSFISTGVYGYPKEEALEIASSAICSFLETEQAADMAVYLVLFDAAVFKLAKERLAGVAQCLEVH